MVEKRADFFHAMSEIDPKDIIVIDESGSDLKQCNEYARAEGGARAKAAKPHCPGERFSIIGAISSYAILAISYVVCAVNGQIFTHFIKHLLLPKLKRGQYVLMDNISFHKQRTVRELIESVGARVVFLPPYSPDLSPIEKMWSKIKTILKKLKPRTKAEFQDALLHALDAVSDDDLEAWYENCGYQA